MAQLRENLSLGVPMGMAIFMEASIFGVIAIFIAKFGTVIIAAHQAAMSFTSLLYMVPLSFSMSLTIVVALKPVPAVSAKRCATVCSELPAILRLQCADDFCIVRP